MNVSRLRDLSDKQKLNLYKFIEDESENFYQSYEYNHYINHCFNYIDYSLVCYEGNKIYGYIPQWVRNKCIESIPWRDRGGPITKCETAETYLIKATDELSKKIHRPFIWRNYFNSSLKTNREFVKVSINTLSFRKKSVYDAVTTKVRNKLKLARKNELTCKIGPLNSEKVDSFYKLFFGNRKKFGVPVYCKYIFQNLYKILKEDNVINLEVLCKDKTVLSSMIFFAYKGCIIDAYAASSKVGKQLNANDFAIFKMLEFCVSNNYNIFDFGADSRQQNSLISYKLKWGGESEEVINSSNEVFSDIDHHNRKYDFVRFVLRHSPDFVYKLFSKLIIGVI